MKKVNILSLVLFLGVLFALAVAAMAAAPEKPAKRSAAITAGKTVKVNYTLTVDGKVVDSSKGRQPLEFKTGTHQMIPGFEKAVMGMKPGEKKSFRVSPQDGYGAVNPKAYREVPKKQLPAGIKPKAGMTLSATGKNGQKFPVKIREVKKDTVVVDFNHPLAGKTLNFDVEVVSIQ